MAFPLSRASRTVRLFPNIEFSDPVRYSEKNKPPVFISMAALGAMVYSFVIR